MSLLVTVHNGERFLDEALASVSAQSFGDFECIVWDDGSSDGSRELIATHAARDSRIQLVVGERRGPAGALAAVHALAQGRFVGYLDQDDRLAPGALRDTHQVLLAKPDVGFVYTDHVEIDEEGRELGLGERCRIPFSLDAMLIAFMTFHFRLVRRELYEAVGGFRSEYVECADYDLCLRLAEVAGVAHLKRPHYAYRLHPASVSATNRAAQRESAARASRDALRRRGLADRWRLEVLDDGRFNLVALDSR